MNLRKYSEYTSLEEKKEIDKCLYLGYFLMVKESKTECSTDDLLNCFDTLHFSRPNLSRLKKNIKGSKSFISGSSKSTFKLHAKVISQLNSELPKLKNKSEEIISDDHILPELLYIKTRGYIESLAKQINASYENNIFDGCAVLIRRLFEVLLINSYENNSIESEIKDSSGNYKILSYIISNAKTNSKLNLSRNTKNSLDDFRTIGNFSAHKIFYNAQKKDIDLIKKEFRATIEELLYKSGIKS